MMKLASWTDGTRLFAAVVTLGILVIAQIFYLGRYTGRMESKFDAQAEALVVWQTAHVVRPHGDVEKELLIHDGLIRGLLAEQLKINAWIDKGDRFTEEDGSRLDEKNRHRIDSLRDILMLSIESLKSQLSRIEEQFKIVPRRQNSLTKGLTK